MYNYTITIDGHTFGNDEISEPKLKKAVSARGFPIGEVVIGTFSVSLPPGIPAGENVYSPFSERAKVEFKVATEAEQLSLGTYFIGKRKHSHKFIGIGSRISLTCYDRLAFANQDFDMEGDEKTEVSYTAALNYIAQKIGCAVDIPAGLGGCYFRLDRDRTMRDVLSLIAGATGTNCMMSRRDVMTFVKPFHADGNYYAIPDEDRTEPFLGREWLPTKVTVYNDKDSFSAGDGDFMHEVELQNDAASQEMTDSIYADLIGHAYLPYKVQRAKVPLWLDLFDNTNAWAYENHTGDSVVVSKSFIGSLSMDFLPDCAYATFSADDIDEVRDEFAWLTDRDKVKKDEKISGNSLGNRYGMKSVKVTKGKNTVGAEEAETVTEARFDNAEITFSDKTDINNPLDCGRICVDGDGDLNVHSGGLLTEAQDFKGAINELFGQGASGGWVRPVSWLPLPEPEPNQAVFLIVPEDEKPITGEIIISISSTETDNPPTGTVDFGAGYDIVDLETLQNEQSSQWYKVVPVPENYGGGYEQKIIAVTITSGAVKIVLPGYTADACFGADWSTEFDGWCGMSGYNKINHIKKIGAPDILGALSINYCRQHYFKIDTSKTEELRLSDYMYTRMYFPKAKKLKAVNGQIVCVNSCRYYGMTTLYLPELDEVDFNGGTYNNPDGYISPELISDIVCPVKFKAHPAFKELADGKNGVRWIDPTDLKEYGGNLDFKLR